MIQKLRIYKVDKCVMPKPFSGPSAISARSRVGKYHEHMELCQKRIIVYHVMSTAPHSNWEALLLLTSNGWLNSFDGGGKRCCYECAWCQNLVQNYQSNQSARIAAQIAPLHIWTKAP